LDPDDVAKQGKEAYQKCLDAAMPLVDYKLHAVERKYDLSRTDSKRAFVKEALQIVAETDSSAVREDLLKKLRDKTGLTYQSLERDLENLGKEKKAEPADGIGTNVKIAEVAHGSDKTDKAERFILAAKLFGADYAKGVSIEKLHFENSVHARIAAYITVCEAEGARIRPTELFEIFDENCPAFNEILDLNYEDKLEGEVAKRFFMDSVATLEKESIDREITLLQEELAKTDEQAKRLEILKSLQDALLRQKRRR
jgi:DNA primase